MKIDFSFETQYGNFSDAIVLPDDHTLTDDEIEAMKQHRLENWIVAVTAPSVEENIVTEPNLEE
jgi:hypothetical protein